MKITIIGSGNVAWHLSQALKLSACNIIQVYSRNIVNAEKLANILSSDYISDFHKLNKKSDLYIISISDNALLEICKNELLREKINNNLVVHTAGGVNMGIIENLSHNFGVFYPLQTFSKKKRVDFSDIPICIEANKKNNENILKNIASEISNDVRIVNSEQRQYIHLAAVFACNFTNHFYSVAENILTDNNIDFNILLPLIKETTDKIEKFSPASVQTGPAHRNDQIILKKHVDLLKNYPDLQKIYSFVSENILNFQHKK